ncbi:MAG: protein phosphatase 2C domain-containing protein [Dysgonamonadaceae bacterium]|jgi:protein phosphatase|nr:protein phosphatase 2C domain-containing protein [Dysgonamonadaceae bacterium]
MYITIKKPFSINEIGKKMNNEDSIDPNSGQGSVADRLFLVCDGVGGLNKGEVASSVACDSIRTYFNTFLDTKEKFDPEFIRKAIRYTEIRFDDYIKENPAAKGMSTTLCLLYLASDSIYLTHAGDSRIYQFRKGEIIFRTEDHSLLNSMIKTGKISPEEAERHPQRNVIYKAIQGSKVPVDIDITQITDIQPDDRFLMCTDGVTESLEDNELSELFSKNDSPEEILSVIKNHCNDQSQDNYSAYLITINEIEEMSTFKHVMTSFLYAFV